MLESQLHKVSLMLKSLSREELVLETGLVEVHLVVALTQLLLVMLLKTKESIRRATHLAINCAKYGISNEVVELIWKLETELSHHRKVDLFFLVDSIT